MVWTEVGRNPRSKLASPKTIKKIPTYCILHTDTHTHRLITARLSSITAYSSRLPLPPSLHLLIPPFLHPLPYFFHPTEWAFKSMFVCVMREDSDGFHQFLPKPPHNGPIMQPSAQGREGERRRTVRRSGKHKESEKFGKDAEGWRRERHRETHQKS